MFVDRHEVVRLPARLREPPFQKIIERLQVLDPPILTRPHLAQISTKFYELGVATHLYPLLPSKDLVDLPEHKPSSLGVELGQDRWLISTQAHQTHQRDFLLAGGSAWLR